mmetsp:Transcript_22786/g.36696  ORF Transcript_22786/g.36696 Transcript_22786/m.36696 type:complete len:125 (-) Transcript_22786:1489-1863(-)
MRTFSCQEEHVTSDLLPYWQNIPGPSDGASPCLYYRPLARLCLISKSGTPAHTLADADDPTKKVTVEHVFGHDSVSCRAVPAIVCNDVHKLALATIRTPIILKTIPRSALVAPPREHLIMCELS